jgi:hypothetical protein
MFLSIKEPEKYQKVNNCVGSFKSNHSLAIIWIKYCKDKNKPSMEICTCRNWSLNWQENVNKITAML